MKVFGWIPHLGPGLEVFIQNPALLLSESVDIFCDDTGGSGPMHMDIALPEQFVYGETVLPLHVTYGKVSLDVSMVLDNRGILSLETPGQDFIENDKVRHVLREVYFEMKRRFHSDTHHQSDERTRNGLRGPDEQSPLSHGDKTEEQAIAEIFNSLLKSIYDKNNGLSRLIAMPRSDDRAKLEKQELMIHDLYKSASGFVSYAMNYVNLFFENNPVYTNSLRAYRASLDSLYTSHCNEDTHRLNISFLRSTELMKEQNDRATDIAKKMNRYTLLMLIFTAINVGIAIWQLFHV